MPFVSTTLSLKARALRALAGREYSRVELGRKLAPHVGPDDDLEALQNELEAKGFLSDLRAAQAIAHRRAPKLGSQRVLYELRSKGVAEEAMAQVAQTLRDTELERARAVWEKKFGEVAVDATERGRQMRFLAARGFGSDAISRVMRGPEQ